MKNVLLRAPLLTNSGYGIHSRQIFEWLLTRKDVNITTQTLNWGDTPWMMNLSAENGVFGKIVERAKSIENKKFDITFQNQLPDEWDEKLGLFNVGVTALVETDKCNPVWFDKIKKMDQIIVPSNFTKNVITNTFGNVFDKKIHVVPEWFSPSFTYKESDLKKVRDDRFNFETSFNLLTVGTLTSLDVDCDRKNLVNTLRWAIEALEGRDDSGIIVKTSFGRGSVKDREMTKSIVGQIKNTFRKSDFPKIYLLHGNMTDVEVASLYQSNKIKGYISATRGEGYGLPLIEAAASGIPVVATNWSGHIDFLEDLFLKVDYNLKEIPQRRIDNRIFVNGVKWAEPDRNSFIQQINELIKNHKEHAEVARDLKKQVTHKFSKEKICKKYDKFLMETLSL